MQYHIHTLRNGLRVVLAPMPQTRTATIMVMTGTGSRFETEHENGLAHFLEHMFFKGTKKRPSARQISEELDTIGSVYNAYTSKDRTAYYAKVSNRYIDTAIDVISDMFLHSTLPPAEVTKERGAILQEIDMYEDMPMRTVSDVFDALIFSDDAEPSSHALARTILGPKENIRRFTRADFQAYLKRNYLPGNTVVCVAGAFSQAKVLKKIRADFSQPQADELPIHVPFTATQSAPRVAIKQKATDQTQLILGVPAYPYGHRDEYALSVLTTILGGGMSSRLFIEVREKRGLAYTVSAWTDKYPDAGYLAVQAGVEHAKLSKTIATILSELRKLKRTAVSQTELNKAKAYIRGTKTLSLETCDEIAGNAASSILNFGKVRTLEEYMAGIDAVTSADLTRVARDIFKTERLNLAVIGPHTNRDSLSSLLKI